MDGLYVTLIWNLLIGGRMGRYTGSPDTLVLDQRVEVRGFSAGSFAGLCLYCSYCGRSPMWLRVASWGQLPPRRNYC